MTFQKNGSFLFLIRFKALNGNKRKSNNFKSQTKKKDTTKTLEARRKKRIKGVIQRMEERW